MYKQTLLLKNKTQPPHLIKHVLKLITSDADFSVFVLNKDEFDDDLFCKEIVIHGMIL